MLLMWFRACTYILMGYGMTIQSDLHWCSPSLGRQQSMNIIILSLIERFSNECCKTKTKVLPQPITTKTNYPMNQSELEANAGNRHQVRENVCEQVAIGLSFTCDWSRKWREIF